MIECLWRRSAPSIKGAGQTLTEIYFDNLGMHPAVGLLLERHVPKGGIILAGHFLPEGSIVGMNPWVSA